MQACFVQENVFTSTHFLFRRILKCIYICRPQKGGCLLRGSKCSNKSRTLKALFKNEKFTLLYAVRISIDLLLKEIFYALFFTFFFSIKKFENHCFIHPKSCSKLCSQLSFLLDQSFSIWPRLTLSCLLFPEQHKLICFSPQLLFQFHQHLQWWPLIMSAQLWKQCEKLASWFAVSLILWLSGYSKGKVSGEWQRSLS